MKKIVFIVPWFGKLREDFYFWLKSVEMNPTIDFLIFTDQHIHIKTSPSRHIRIFNTQLSFIEQLARERIWEGCIISKPYKLCDYKVAYGEIFQDYIKGYDFWRHCDMDMIFGDIRHFITDELLSKYDRIGVDGFFTLFRNTSEINSIYRKAGDIKKIFTDQKPFGFDEWGIDQTGTAHYWINNLNNRLNTEKFFDNLAPYHYGFVSGTVKKFKLGITNIMFSFENGKLYRYGTKDGYMVKDETLYVHLQKRCVYAETAVDNYFSIIPPGRYIKYIKNVTPLLLKAKIREGRFWAYYIRAKNKLYRLLGIRKSSNLVLCPDEDM